MIEHRRAFAYYLDLTDVTLTGDTVFVRYLFKILNLTRRALPEDPEIRRNDRLSAAQ